MIFALMLCLFLSTGFSALAQVQPTSYGLCAVSAAGLIRCEGISTPPVTFKGDKPALPKADAKGVFVTRWNRERLCAVWLRATMSSCWNE